MSHLEVGQRVHVDLIGMRLGGAGLAIPRAAATVVALGPGVITVRLDLEEAAAAEITIGPGRLQRGFAGRT